MSILNDCTICPRNCHINRTKTQGFCGVLDKLIVARSDLHFFEEPCLSGTKGSGTIFFSFCNLKCLYCQNYDISTKHLGKEITIKRFSELCLELQKKGALNINLVTPTPYAPLIIDGLKLAKKNGLNIPIIYNTSSYENVETIKMLDGLIDIYLPDLKYYDDEIALKYSSAPNYFKYASEAINEMYNQVGKPKFNKGIMTKGVIVRHLILPTHLEDTKKILKYLYNTYKNNIYYSIMNQYTPIRKLKYKELNQTIDNKDYEDIINYAYCLGIRKAFVQEDKTQDISFIPDFKKSINKI